MPSGAWPGYGLYPPEAYSQSNPGDLQLPWWQTQTPDIGGGGGLLPQGGMNPETASWLSEIMGQITGGFPQGLPAGAPAGTPTGIPGSTPGSSSPGTQTGQMKLPQWAYPALTLASALLGGLGNREAARTGKSSYSRTPTLIPEFQPLQSSLAGELLSGIQNPTAGLAPLKTQAIGNVNSLYAGMPGVITRQLASRGFGRSGKVGQNLTKLQLSRAGQIGGIESDFANLAMNQQNKSMALAEALLGQGRGSSGSGTEVNPGDALAGALGGGLGMLMQLIGIYSSIGGNNAPKSSTSGFWG